MPKSKYRERKEAKAGGKKLKKRAKKSANITKAGVKGRFR